MNVLVVGAGSSGLVTMKELQDEGHDFECIESCGHLGGVFFYDKDKGGVYDSTLLTVSNYFMTFSSLPPAASEPRRFWTHTEYLSYLRRFAEHFQLSSKIQYNTSLTRLRFEPEQVVATLSVSGRQETRVYDAVAICTGTHQIPSFPNLECPDGRLRCGRAPLLR